MCGRFEQRHVARQYAMEASWERIRDESQARPSHNIPPGTARPVFSRGEGDELVIEDRFWGYQPLWAQGKVPVASNARMDKLGNGYWGRLMKARRAIVAVDAWYEWTGGKGEKQPWRIHRADGKFLYLAALLSPDKEADTPAATGFALVTTAAEGGMVDIHDRRPIVFAPEDALMWLNPDTPPDQAEHHARSLALPPEAFAWHKVSKALGNSRNQGAELAAPIDE